MVYDFCPRSAGRTPEGSPTAEASAGASSCRPAHRCGRLWNGVKSAHGHAGVPHDTPFLNFAGRRRVRTALGKYSTETRGLRGPVPTGPSEP